MFELFDVPNELVEIEAEHLRGWAQNFTRVGPTESRQVRLQLQPGLDVQGEVLSDSGRVCATGLVTMRAGAIKAREFEAVTDHEGHFNFTGVPRGEYEVDVSCDSMRPLRGVGVFVEQPTSGLQFRLRDGHSLCGALVWPVAVPEDEVSLLIYADDTSAEPFYREQVVGPDVSQFCFEGLSAGGHTIRARAVSGVAGTASGGVRVDVGAESPPDVLVELTRWGEIVARLNCGLADLRVVAKLVSEDFFVDAWSGSAGEVRLGPVFAGTYSVGVNDLWAMSDEPADGGGVYVEVSGATVHVDIPCPEGVDETYTLRGRVLEPDGSPVSNVAISLYARPSELRTVYSDDEGEFIFDEVFARSRAKTLRADASDGRMIRSGVDHDSRSEYVLQFPEHGALVVGGGDSRVPFVAEVISSGFRRAVAVDVGQSVTVNAVPANQDLNVYAYFPDGTKLQKTVLVDERATVDVQFSAVQ